MVKVLLLSVARDDPADPFPRGALLRLRESQQLDAFGVHRLTEDPEIAEIILFAENRDAGFYFEFVRSHPYYRRYREKCYLYCPNDQFVPFLPGIYPSIEQEYYRPDWTSSGSYLSIQENPYIEFAPLNGDEAYLTSFIGSIANAPVRGQLSTLASERCPIVDTSTYALRTNIAGTQEERLQFWKQYADLMRASKFVLCPRGVGPGSIRLFEAMKMGRAPVILSDAWVAPEGPDWNSFSLRLAEQDYRQIPELLQQREAAAPQLGLAARQAWEAWFAPPVIFHRMVETCLQLRTRRRLPYSVMSLTASLQLLRPWHARNYLRTRTRLYREQRRLIF